MVYVHFYIVSKCTGCRILFLDEFSFISTNVRLAKISTIYVILKEEKTKENRLNRLKIDKQDSNKKQTRPKDVKDLFMALCYNQWIYWLYTGKSVHKNLWVIRLFRAAKRIFGPEGKRKLALPPSIFQFSKIVTAGEREHIHIYQVIHHQSARGPHESMLKGIKSYLCLMQTGHMYILFLVALGVLIDCRVKSRWNIHVLFSSNCTYLCKIPMH